MKYTIMGIGIQPSLKNHTCFLYKMILYHYIQFQDIHYSDPLDTYCITYRYPVPPCQTFFKLWFTLVISTISVSTSSIKY